MRKALILGSLALIGASLTGLQPVDASTPTPPTNPRPPITVGSSGSRSAQTVTSSGAPARAVHFVTFPEHFDSDILTSDMYVSQYSTFADDFYMNAFKTFNDSGYGGYMGFQTNMAHCNNGNHDGKGFILTFWNASAPGVISMGTGGYSCSGTEVGQPYKSIHIPYNWTTNQWYQYYARVSWNASYAHWQLCSSFYTGSAWIYVGCILTPSNNYSWFLGNTSAAGHEIERYNPTTYADCNTMPVGRVIWGTTKLHSQSAGDMLPSTNTGYVESGAGICTNSGTYIINANDRGEVIGVTA